MIVISPALIIALMGAVPVECHHTTLVAERVRDCGDVVDRVLLKTKGRLLSIRMHDDRCTVTVLVPHNGDRPEKIVVRVKYADNYLGQDKK